MLLLWRLQAEVFHWRTKLAFQTVAQHNQSTSSPSSELLRTGKNMLCNPTDLAECLREWEDLEKNYQQIQVKKNLNKTEQKLLVGSQVPGENRLVAAG